MKKLFCVLAVLVLFAAFFSTASAQDTCYANGDFNGDGLILTVSDLALGIRAMVCDTILSSNNLYIWDLTGDCVIDTADVHIIVNYHIYGSSALPQPFPVPTCCNPTLAPFLTAAKGDVNTDGGFSPADVSLMLTCAFTGTGGCSFCQTDLNCDHILSPADVVQELNYVFNGTAPAGCP